MLINPDPLLSIKTYRRTEKLSLVCLSSVLVWRHCCLAPLLFDATAVWRHCCLTPLLSWTTGRFTPKKTSDAPRKGAWVGRGYCLGICSRSQRKNLWQIRTTAKGVNNGSWFVTHYLVFVVPVVPPSADRSVSRRSSTLGRLLTHRTDSARLSCTCCAKHSNTPVTSLWFMGRRHLRSGHGKPPMDKEMSKFWTSIGIPLQVYVK
jgi:hypothetical protein